MILRRKKYLLIFFLWTSPLVMSQGFFQLDDLHYRNQIKNQDLYFSADLDNHSSIKPLIAYKQSKTGKGTYKINKICSGGVMRKNPYQISVYPITNLSLGYDNFTQTTYTAGLGLGLDFASNRFYFTAKFLPYLNQTGFVGDSIQQYALIDAGTGRQLGNNIFQQSEIIGVWRANKFFTLMGGLGKNFFGEGYRSLFLSDNIASTPFFKMETSFGGIKYVNIFSLWNDFYENPQQKSNDLFKFSNTHYVSWNITKEFNLSIFESVVWQGKDTLTNRFFDPNYLNPFVFYRPVEYSLGSSDNILMGLSMSFKLDQKHIMYYQVIIDEFLLSEIKAKNKWWANKFGMQLGYKQRDFLTENLFFLAEFNFVRPFTYAHKSSLQSYGSHNAVAAHPLGANFFEITNILSYVKDKHQITNKITYSGYGLDSNATSYGQNIFASYQNRDGNYDHAIMQGVKTNVFNQNLIYEYEVLPKINLYFTLNYNWRFEVNSYGTRNNHFLQMGIKSRFWNRYTDF